MTPEKVMSRCYEHGQPDYVLAGDTIKTLLSTLQEVISLHDKRIAPTPETVERWRSALSVNDRGTEA